MVTAKEIRDEERELYRKFLDVWDEADRKRLEGILPKLPEDAREGFIRLVTDGEMSPEFEKRYENDKQLLDAFDEFMHGDTYLKEMVSAIDQMGFLEEGCPEPGKD